MSEASIKLVSYSIGIYFYVSETPLKMSIIIDEDTMIRLVPTTYRKCEYICDRNDYNTGVIL